MDDHDRRPEELPTTPPHKRLGSELLWGTVLAAIGILVSLAVPNATLTCRRDVPGPPACRLQWGIVFDLVTTRDTSIEGLRGVEHEVLGDDDRETEPNHQILLHDEWDSLKMNFLGRKEPVARTAAEILAFLDDPQATELATVLKPTGIFRTMRWAGNGLVVFGLSYFLAVPWRVYQILRRMQTLPPG